jgi:outer membrane protein insertion porin family
LAAFLCCSLLNFSAPAQTLKKPAIVITGNERVENETILGFLPNFDSKKEVKNFSQKTIDEALKNIYESDLFSDVKISQENNRLLIEVKENPIIAEVKFIGNKKIEDDALQGEISLKKRGIFTKSKLQSDLKRINEIYLKSGRFLARIDPQIIQKEQNRIDIIFEIFEGQKARISDIYFVGNLAFSDRELLDEVSTKKSKWYKFLSSSDVYDSDRIEFDKEKLRRFYGSKGYADFAAISSIAQINQNKDKFI